MQPGTQRMPTRSTNAPLNTVQPEACVVPYQCRIPFFVAHVIGALWVLLGFCGTARATPDALVMGLVCTDSRDALHETWDPILKEISETVGVSIKALVLDDYAGVIWYLARGKADIAWLGNKSAIEAVDRAKVEIVAKTLTRHGEGYYAHLITRKDSGLESVQDVIDNAGRLVFGNGDPNSTSGFLVPGYYLFATRGVDPDAIFKRVLHHNHEGNFHAVLEGRADVATNNSQALTLYRNLYPKQYEDIRIIWTSPLIPSDPIVVRKALPEPLKKSIRSALVQFARPASGKSTEHVKRQQQMLSAREWTGFAPSDNSQLLPIRKLSLFKERMLIMNNESLPDDRRSKLLEALDRKLKMLESREASAQ